MQEGIFQGKITNYGILGGERKDDGSIKLPQFFVKFNVQDEIGTKQLTWFGGMKPLTPGKQVSQVEITVKTLLDMGFAGNDSSELAGGIDTGLLNASKEYNLKIEFQKDQMGTVKVDTQGEPKMQVSAVYDPDNSGFKNQIDKATASAQLIHYNVNNEIMRLRASRPAPGTSANQNTQNSYTSPDPTQNQINQANLIQGQQQMNQGQQQNTELPF